MPNLSPLKLSLSGLTLTCGNHGISWGFDQNSVVQHVSVLITRNEIDIVKFEGNQYYSLQGFSGCVRFELTEDEARWLCDFYKQEVTQIKK